MNLSLSTIISGLAAMSALLAGFVGDVPYAVAIVIAFIALSFALW